MSGKATLFGDSDDMISFLSLHSPEVVAPDVDDGGPLAHLEQLVLVVAEGAVDALLGREGAALHLEVVVAVDAVGLAAVVAGARQLRLEAGPHLAVVVADRQVAVDVAGPERDVDGQAVAALLVDRQHALVDAVGARHRLGVAVAAAGRPRRRLPVVVRVAVGLVGRRLQDRLRLRQHEVVAHARVDGVQAGLGRDLERRVDLDALAHPATNNKQQSMMYHDINCNVTSTKTW